MQGGSGGMNRNNLPVSGVVGDGDGGGKGQFPRIKTRLRLD